MRPSTNKSRILEWGVRYTSAFEHVERLTPIRPSDTFPRSGEGQHCGSFLSDVNWSTYNE